MMCKELSVVEFAKIMTAHFDWLKVVDFQEK